MNWSLAFEPLLSWAMAGRRPGADRAAWRSPACSSASAARCCASQRSQRWLPALINPVLLDEEREPLKSVVALVVDRSQSQDIGDRQAETSAALAGLQQRLARFPQFEVRVVEAGRADAADERTETRLFGALESAFRDVPPSRIAGAVMVTDGQVHDVPGRYAGLPGAAACADHRRRRREVTAASASRTRRASAWSASRCR